MANSQNIGNCQLFGNGTCGCKPNDCALFPVTPGPSVTVPPPFHHGNPPSPPAGSAGGNGGWPPSIWNGPMKVTLAEDRGTFVDDEQAQASANFSLVVMLLDPQDDTPVGNASRAAMRAFAKALRGTNEKSADAAEQVADYWDRKIYEDRRKK